MSKLDSLLGMVDTISARSDKLVSKINESNTIISLIMELNLSISRYDSEIDSMSQLASQNNGYLAEFQKLYEKSFFLESNFGFNDCHTNDVSFNNLHSEYDYLWNEFHIANTNSGSLHTQHTPSSVMSMGHMSDKDPVPLKTVKNVISISNLNLKPLRCRESKVSKQKSRYRLSEAYTLNPLQAQPIREVLEDSTNTKYSDIMTSCDQEQRDDTSISTVQGLSSSVINHDKLARTPNFQEVEHSAREASLEETSLPLLFKSTQSEMCDGIEADDNVSLNMDSHGSPDSRFEDFDNFHQFLRQSRINLQGPVPRLERAKSEDSVFTVTRSPRPVEFALKSIPQPKFHNPADKISHNKSLSSQTTVEAIYSKGVDETSKFKEHSAKLLASHSESTPKANSNVTTPRKAQNYDFFSLMNSPLGSPRGIGRPHSSGNTQNTFSSTSITVSPCNPERRSSIDVLGKSLASGFMSLVSTSSLLKNTRVVPSNECKGCESSKSPPEKIKKLKKDLKDPIALKNEIKSKRLPPSDRHSKNGSFSSLTIGPNKTKIIDHGDSSILKKSDLRQLSQALLKDTFNESLLL